MKEVKEWYEVTAWVWRPIQKDPECPEYDLVLIWEGTDREEAIRLVDSAEITDNVPQFDAWREFDDGEYAERTKIRCKDCAGIWDETEV